MPTGHVPADPISNADYMDLAYSLPSIGRLSLYMRQPEIIDEMMDCRDMMSSRTAT